MNNCSPPTDQCPSYFQAMVILSQLSLPNLNTRHDILLYRISLWPVWVTCLGHALSLLFVQLHAGRGWDTEKILTGEALLRNSWSISVLSLSSHWIQTTALYKLLRRKLPLCQLKPGHLGSKMARKGNSPLKPQLFKQWTGPAEVS